jgi:hypothetical protein
LRAVLPVKRAQLGLPISLFCSESCPVLDASAGSRSAALLGKPTTTLYATESPCGPPTYVMRCCKTHTGATGSAWHASPLHMVRSCQLHYPLQVRYSRISSTSPHTYCTALTLTLTLALIAHSLTTMQQLAPQNPNIAVWPQFCVNGPTTLILQEKAFSFTGVNPECCSAGCWRNRLTP